MKSPRLQQDLPLHDGHTLPLPNCYNDSKKMAWVAGGAGNPLEACVKFMQMNYTFQPTVTCTACDVV